MVVLSQL